MNQIIGYDAHGGTKFPRFSGPCKGCGAVNYGLSTSGPDYCGSCACGTPPEVTQLRRKLQELGSEHLVALLALQVATGHKVNSMTPEMRKSGEEALRRFENTGSLGVNKA